MKLILAHASSKDFQPVPPSTILEEDGRRSALEVKSQPDGTRYLNPPRVVNDGLGTVVVVEYDGGKIEK